MKKMTFREIETDDAVIFIDPPLVIEIHDTFAICEEFGITSHSKQPLADILREIIFRWDEATEIRPWTLPDPLLKRMFEIGDNSL
jgi:hypothetical protein